MLFIFTFDIISLEIMLVWLIVDNVHAINYGIYDLVCCCYLPAGTLVCMFDNVQLCRYNTKWYHDEYHRYYPVEIESMVHLCNIDYVNVRVLYPHP